MERGSSLDYEIMIPDQTNVNQSNLFLVDVLLKVTTIFSYSIMLKNK